MSLKNAPEEIKLAIDLIMLLENQKIPAEIVLKTLEIVRKDFEGKLTFSNSEKVKKLDTTNVSRL